MSWNQLAAIRMQICDRIMTNRIDMTSTHKTSTAKNLFKKNQASRSMLGMKIKACCNNFGFGVFLFLLLLLQFQMSVQLLRLAFIIMGRNCLRYSLKTQNYCSTNALNFTNFTFFEVIWIEVHTNTQTNTTTDARPNTTERKYDKNCAALQDSCWPHS